MCIAHLKSDHDQIRTDTLCSTTPSRWRVYQFLHMALKQKKLSDCLTLLSDLAGIRTQDPIIKSDVLYQLSYQVVAMIEMLKKSDLAGIRTQDPIIKSDVLYQLSYQVFQSFPDCGCKYTILNLFYNYKF